MPGFLLHTNATVMCAHGGQAQPAVPFPRVTVNGMAIATMASPHVITGCPFAPPGGNGPCVTAQWLIGATRIMAGGMPVLLQSSVATCVAHGDAAEYRSYANQGDRTMSQLDYPFHFDTRGRTAEAAEDAHIRDLIEQVLFTAPGERVNRPTFGCGLMQLVFAPNSDALAATSQFLIQGALQQWLGDLIAVESVQVENDDATLRVTIQYIVRRTQTRQTAEFSRGGLGA